MAHSQNGVKASVLPKADASEELFGNRISPLAMFNKFLDKRLTL